MEIVDRFDRPVQQCKAQGSRLKLDKVGIYPVTGYLPIPILQYIYSTVRYYSTISSMVYGVRGRMRQGWRDRLEASWKWDWKWDGKWDGFLGQRLSEAIIEPEG